MSYDSCAGSPSPGEGSEGLGGERGLGTRAHASHSGLRGKVSCSRASAHPCPGAPEHVVSNFTLHPAITAVCDVVVPLRLAGVVICSLTQEYVSLSELHKEVFALQGPHEMLACASLLGDLFPAAWPPSGAARPGQGSHPPPAHMRYRAALAKSFEPLTQEALRNLMACAVASESLIFRAALVRLCARASGRQPDNTSRRSSA